MNKQTVQERYHQQQKMQGKVDAKVKRKATQGQEVSIEQLLQHISHGLVQADQSIRQASNEQPSVYLANAESRIAYTIGYVEQLKEELQVGNKMLQGSTTQQIEQLNTYVLQAAQTVKLIQTQLKQTKKA